MRTDGRWLPSASLAFLTLLVAHFYALRVKQCAPKAWEKRESGGQLATLRVSRFYHAFRWPIVGPFGTFCDFGGPFFCTCWVLLAVRSRQNRCVVARCSGGPTPRHPTNSSVMLMCKSGFRSYVMHVLALVAKSVQCSCMPPRAGLHLVCVSSAGSAVSALFCMVVGIATVRGCVSGVRFVLLHIHLPHLSACTSA